MKNFICLIVLVFSNCSIKAQLVYNFDTTGHQSVKNTVNALFTAMQKADSAGLINCFTTEAQLQTVKVDSLGNTSVQTQDVSRFASSVGKQKAGKLDERIEFGFIAIDGNLATVWTPYRFYYDKQFLHCGVNSFQLVKINGHWKIQYLIDTRRKQPCTP